MLVARRLRRKQGAFFMKWKLAVVLGCLAGAAFAVEESEVLA